MIRSIPRPAAVLALAAVFLGWVGCSDMRPGDPAPAPTAIEPALKAIAMSPWASLLDSGTRLQRGAEGWELPPPLGRSEYPIGAQAPTAGDGAIVIEGAGESLRITALDREGVEGQPVGNAVVYAGAREATDSVVALSRRAIEELIVLHGPEASQTLRYRVDLGPGMTVVEHREGVVVVDSLGRQLPLCQGSCRLS